LQWWRARRGGRPPRRRPPPARPQRPPPAYTGPRPTRTTLRRRRGVARRRRLLWLHCHGWRREGRSPPLPAQRAPAATAADAAEGATPGRRRAAVGAGQPARRCVPAPPPGDHFDPHPRVGGGVRANGRRDSSEGSEAVAGVDHRRRRAARHGRRESGEQRGHGTDVDGGSRRNSRALPRHRDAEGDPHGRHGRPRQAHGGGGGGGGGGGYLHHGDDRRVGRPRPPPRHPVAISIPCRSPPAPTCRRPPSR